MNTAARQSCVDEISQEKGLGLNGHEGNKPLLAQAKKPTPRESPGGKVRVLIAAENRLLCEALTRVLSKQEDMHVFCVDWTKADGVKRLPEGEGEVLLLSSQGNLSDDLDTIQQVRTSAPKLRILLLGMSGDEKEFLQCVRAGVSGYLLQDACGDEVVEAIKAVAAGEAVCRASLCGVLFRYFERETAALPSAAVRQRLGLTRREQQLIPLIARGLTNKEIANHFSLSEQTIKNHVYRMKHKIGAEDRLDIVQLYRVQSFLV